MKNNIDNNKIDSLFLIYVGKVVFGTIVASLFMKYAMEEINFTSFPMIPFFACIGVLVGMEPNINKAIDNIVVRNVGTIVAGIIGGIIASFTENIFLICIGIIPCLIILALINRRESIVPAGIFYFAITYLTTLDNAWMYAFNRTIGTIIGTVIGYAINVLILPNKNTD